MSAPDTNLEKQKRRHAGPLIGIGAGLVFVAIILVAYLTFMSGGVAEGEADVVESPRIVDPAAEPLTPAEATTAPVN